MIFTEFYNLMSLPYNIENFLLAAQTIKVCVPENHAVKDWYLQNTPAGFPYWAKVWDASVGLSMFIALNEKLFFGKKVLELASGLGLPSLTVAGFADTVVCSDFINQPLQYVQLSAKENRVINLSTEKIDWNEYAKNEINEEIILLSDVNYDPDCFGELYKCFLRILQQQKTIVLSTPQRLMAKPFIEKIFPFVQQQELFNVNRKDVSVYVLKT